MSISDRRIKLAGMFTIALATLLNAGLLNSAAIAADESGFESIFDGKSLDGWDGNKKFWRVEEGAITGQTTKDNPTTGNTFIIWRKGKLADFELKLEYRITPNNDRGFANSGIQYRSFELPDQKWVVGGYQADFEAGKKFSGILYSEKARGILALRGQKTVIGKNGKPKTVGSVGNSDEIQAKIKANDWNAYHIIARGNHFIHKINGLTTVEVTDEDIEGPKRRAASGILALQLHAGPPMKVQFRKILLKQLKPAKQTAVDVNATKFVIRVDDAGIISRDDRRLSLQQLTADLKVLAQRNSASRLIIRAHPKSRHDRIVQIIDTASNVGISQISLAIATSSKAKKKIALIAGKKSHGYGAHEHRAGCMLLAKALNDSGLDVEATVYTGGWPEDASVLNDADSIVIYADGGGRHPFNAHIEELDKLMKRGVGMVCIHYGVEVPKGKSGDAFLDWTGGYFEANWSVNPHWTAHYKKFPKHAIANGVKPFTINDEWYYHMRFRENMEGVTPILSDLPGAETLKRKDGPHSNNKFVRKAVLEQKQSQHMAWARQRPGGGRGFGFTGGHNHWNWGNDEFRKLVLNAIVWTARAEVPKSGVPSKPLTVDDLLANQDYAPPDNFNPARIQAMLNQWNRAKVSVK